MININRIITGTKVEGPGIRTCIWFQGCSRHCKGCFAIETWSFEENKLMSVEELFEIINDDFSEGITILGGEPLEQSDSLIELCEKVKATGKTIILFSGYLFEEISNSNKFNRILDLIDVLVDGPFIESQKDYSRPMVGSTNQSFHFLTSKYTYDDFQKNKIELRISPSGQIIINGQGETSFFKNMEEVHNEIQ